MSKNKENKKTNFLTEEKAYEKYILMILSIAAIIYSVLIFLDVFDVSLKGKELTGNNKIIFSIILFAFGIITMFMSIVQILKDAKYKNTVFNELVNDYNNNSIKKYLYDETLDLDMLSIELYKKNIGFEYKVEKGSFHLFVDKKNVDIAIVDLGLPDINGIELTLKIKSISPKTKIIILTSHEKQEEVVACFRNGANAYCSKEIDTKILKFNPKDKRIALDIPSIEE